MRKTVIMSLAILALAGCAGTGKPLAMVKADDPVWQLNPDRWTATENDLITPPEDGTQPLPPPVKAPKLAPASWQ